VLLLAGDAGIEELYFVDDVFFENKPGVRSDGE
jgi:hypothetical protein